MTPKRYGEIWVGVGDVVVFFLEHFSVFFDSKKVWVSPKRPVMSLPTGPVIFSGEANCEGHLVGMG